MSALPNDSRYVSPASTRAASPMGSRGGSFTGKAAHTKSSQSDQSAHSPDGPADTADSGTGDAVLSACAVCITTILSCVLHCVGQLCIGVSAWHSFVSYHNTKCASVISFDKCPTVATAAWSRSSTMLLLTHSVICRHRCQNPGCAWIWLGQSWIWWQR